MKATHRKTLARIAARPSPSDLPWEDVEDLLLAAGVEVQERAGGLIALVKDGRAMVLRRPHSQPLTISATSRDIAAFLKTVGIQP
jgi:hypothetical protein